ncbi:MAG: SOS response-associated peptidase family protein [Cocleimonas sp.]
MCERFDIHINKNKMIEIFDIDQSQLPAFESSSNIPPSTHIPFIFQTENKRQLSSASWGLIPSWTKDKSFASHTFNARSETLTEKVSFKEAYKHRRCLIPVNGKS